MKKILINGNMGYIGPVVVNHFRNKYEGIKIIGFDNGYFAGCLVDPNLFPETSVDMQYFGDVRNFPKEILDGVDAVIQLSAISNDPMGKSFEAPTHDINNSSVIEVAKLSKKMGVKNFVFASSCSVYGASEQTSTEEDKLTPPLSNYDFTKQCIDYINNFSDKNCVGLRFGTVGGYSPNLREELIANAMTVNSNKNKEILVSNGGANRSILGLSDLCRAIETLILAAKIPKKIYNLCSFSNTVLEIGQKVQQISGANLIQNQSLYTNYSFTVSNERFQKDFNFVFADSMESIYNELIENKDRIVLSSNRYGPAK